MQSTDFTYGIWHSAYDRSTCDFIGVNRLHSFATRALSMRKSRDFRVRFLLFCSTFDYTSFPYREELLTSLEIKYHRRKRPLVVHGCAFANTVRQGPKNIYPGDSARLIEFPCGTRDRHFRSRRRDVDRVEASHARPPVDPASARSFNRLSSPLRLLSSSHSVISESR